MTPKFNLAKEQEAYLKEKLGPDIWEFVVDINYIKQLEGQDSITSEQLREIIKKEQNYRYLAKRLRGLREKTVRG
ncbi:MAG: hypothetical protein KAX30_04525 [Candidatus Atribacteria bacterium]|nr:hypothetical protein [Candidatus Atribacteria bacterium]